MDIQLFDFQKLLKLSDDDTRVFISIASIPEDSPPACTVISYVIYQWLCNSGLEDSKAIMAIKYLKEHLIDLGNMLHKEELKWRGALYIVMLQDNQYLATEWDISPFDVKKSKEVDKVEVPIPLSLHGVSPVTAYLRMLATIQNQHSAAEDLESE